MKVICPISRITTQIPTLSGRVTQLHPVLLLSPTALLRNLEDTDTLEPMLLLAVLNQSSLITLDETDAMVIKPTTIYLTRKAYNLFSVVKPTDCYPKFHCTTESVNNLGAYLEALEDAMSATTRKRAISEASLEITTLRRNTPAFPKALTNWLFNTVQFPAIDITGANRKTKTGRIYETIEAYWNAMFLDLATDPKNVFSYPRKDFDELHDFIIENLENESTNSLYTYSICAQVERELKSITLDHSKLLGAIQPTTIQAPKHTELVGAPIPQEVNFLTKTNYLIAIAKWKVANNGKN